MAETSNDPSGLREAASVIITLGDTLATSIIRMLSPDEIRALSREINNFPALSADELNKVLTDFEKEFNHTEFINPDARNQMQKAMQNALGKVHADSLLSSLDHSENDRLLGLHSVKPEYLAKMIGKEQLQMQVVTLSCLNPEQAAEVLALIPEHLQSEIIRRMAKIERLPTQALKRIADMLGEFLKESRQESNVAMPGENLAAELLNQMEKKQVDKLLTQLHSSEEELAARIESKMFVFEHILRLTPESIKMVVGQTDQRTLALAVKGLSTGFREKIYAAMTRRAADYLKDEYNVLGRVPFSAVSQARKDIREKMLVMLESGEIDMTSKDDELVE